MRQEIAAIARPVDPMSLANAADLTLERGSSPPEAAAARGAGAWTVRGIAVLERRIDGLAWPPAGALVVDMARVDALDTAGAWLLHRTVVALRGRGLDVRVEGLRPEFATLVDLVASRAPAPSAIAPPPKLGLLATIGRKTWLDVRNASAFLAFVGEAFVGLLHSLANPRSIRVRAVLHNIQTAGLEALPITGLLSFLMGIVIAYQGADQLQRFGANVFVADLVGIAMLRELSPLMTAIIVAGRSGSAYTAQIGTMKVTEEIDALRTVGIPPLDLLVLPKMIALIIVLPLLTVYTDVAGVLGGMLMAKTQLGLSFDAFLDRLSEAIVLSTYLSGLSKAPIFAAIIALVGCYRGFETGGSADSVGTQTTLSVVQSIFLVIVTDAAFSIVFNRLDL